MNFVSSNLIGPTNFNAEKSNLINGAANQIELKDRERFFLLLKCAGTIFISIGLIFLSTKGRKNISVWYDEFKSGKRNVIIVENFDAKKTNQVGINQLVQSNEKEIKEASTEKETNINEATQHTNEATQLQQQSIEDIDHKKSKSIDGNLCEDSSLVKELLPKESVEEGDNTINYPLEPESEKKDETPKVNHSKIDPELQKIDAELTHLVHLSEYQNAEKLLTESLQKFEKDNIPDVFLAHGFRIKYYLKKYDEANQFCDMLLKNNFNTGTLEFLYLAAYLKSHLGLYLEADDLYTFVFEKFKNIPAYICSQAADVKYHLGDYQKSDHLYTEALLKYSEVPEIVWFYAAYVKFFLGQYKESNNYFSSALKTFTGILPVDTSLMIARIKVKLGLISEANTFCNKALENDSKPISVKSLIEIADFKFQISEFDNADKYYKQAISMCGNDIPSWLLSRSAIAKVKLGQFYEADQLFTQSIENYAGVVPKDILSYAMWVKNVIDNVESNKMNGGETQV